MRELSSHEDANRPTRLDMILPPQCSGPRRKQAPEQRLMMAILHDAVDCIEKYRFATDRHRRRLFHEAKQWLLANETDWPCSFKCICSVLDLDANAVRQRLRVLDDAACASSRSERPANLIPSGLEMEEPLDPRSLLSSIRQ